MDPSPSNTLGVVDKVCSLRTSNICKHQGFRSLNCRDILLSEEVNKCSSQEKIMYMGQEYGVELPSLRWVHVALQCVNAE